MARIWPIKRARTASSPKLSAGWGRSSPRIVASRALARAASNCPGCGLIAPGTGAPRPADRNASPGCWAVYETVLSRSYGLAAYRPVHQIVVDAYIAQHPMSSTRREVAAVALCLMTLCLFVEEGADPRDGAELH